MLLPIWFQEDFNSWNFWKLPPPILDIWGANIFKLVRENTVCAATVQVTRGFSAVYVWENKETCLWLTSLVRMFIHEHSKDTYTKDITENRSSNTWREWIKVTTGSSNMISLHRTWSPYSGFRWASGQWERQIALLRLTFLFLFYKQNHFCQWSFAEVVSRRGSHPPKRCCLCSDDWNGRKERTREISFSIISWLTDGVWACWRLKKIWVSYRWIVPYVSSDVYRILCSCDSLESAVLYIM